MVCKPSTFSTALLHTLLRLHTPPIQLVVSQRSYPTGNLAVTFVGEGTGLEAGFPLRCFQRLSLPDVATQLCRWHDNWHTSGLSTPVLSY